MSDNISLVRIREAVSLVPSPGFRISVVIPLFNSQKWIGETLDSVCTQELRPYEVIIVDDGSTDDSSAEIETISRKYPDIKIQVYTIINSGVSNARNQGMELCTGDLVALLDSDDVWLPQKLKLQLDYLMTNTSCIAVLSDFYITESMPDGRLKDVRLISKKGVTDVGLSWLTLQGNGALLSSTILFWKEKVVGKISFNKELSTAADLDFYLRLTHLGAVGHLIKPLVRYRQHGEQMHLSPELLKRDIPLLLDQLAKSSISFDRKLVLGNMFVMCGVLDFAQKKIFVGCADTLSGIKLNPGSVLKIPFALLYKRIRSYLALILQKWY